MSDPDAFVTAQPKSKLPATHGRSIGLAEHLAQNLGLQYIHPTPLGPQEAPLQGAGNPCPA